MIYDDADFNDIQSSKPATRSNKREIVGNGEIKGNRETTDLDKASFVDFDGRFTGLESSVSGITRDHFKVFDRGEVKGKLIKD